MKIYLQYPWKFPDSPYYKYLIDSPPNGVEYLNVEKQKGVITSKWLFLFSNFLKSNIRTLANKLNISVSNAHLSPKGEYDLIHCAHCLSLNKDKPWVADFESVFQFWIGRKNRITKNIIKRILLRENCKKIIAWTESTKKEIIEEFPEIKEKVEVVYPAIRPRNFGKKQKKKIKIIFSGRYFYWKGGLHALEAIDRLTKIYKNVYGIINSEIPEEIKKEYSSNKKIKFYELIPQEKLFELYRESDIMIYPGYSDTFGFAFLEAMSFGIPIITVDGFARKELVENEKTGFVINQLENLNEKKVKHLEEKIIEELIKNAEKLIKNKKLREEMSKNCLKEIKSGKFSIKERNKKLKKIYGGALK